MNSEELRKLFVDRGALLNGHFLLSSGLHSGQYLQCALLLSDPQIAERLGKSLAEKLKEKPDLVLSPAIGGIVIGQEVAKALGVRHFFAERENGKMVLRRGFSLSQGQKCVVVEDVVTTGGSSQEVIDMADLKGVQTLSVLSIADRGLGPHQFKVPLESLLKIKIETFNPAACPLCHEGTPAVKPGSRTSMGEGASSLYPLDNGRPSK
jgi:orotate phosphoribosyltransferase